MLDWLTWPADLLLNVGGGIASLFLSKDSINFAVAQAMFVLAAVVTLIVYWQTLVGYWRSLWKRMKGRSAAAS